MDLKSALNKLTKRKKRNGYYEASYILTQNEKNSIVIASTLILVPILVTTVLLISF